MDMDTSQQRSAIACAAAGKTRAIDCELIALDIGESKTYPVADKGSVSARVCEINRSLPDRKYVSRTDRVHFNIAVVRER